MTRAFDGLPDPVLVVGGYGYRNVGDEAILSGLLASLRDRSVTVVSHDPDATRRLHGVHTIPISAAPAALLRHQAVIIGGGGLFGRDVGRVGRLLPAFGLAAVALRRPVVVAGVDIDARLAPSTRALLPRLLRRATRVTVRDRRSVAILDGWGVRSTLESDLATQMPPRPPEAGFRLLEQAGVDLARPLVGVAIAGVRPDLADAALAAVGAAMDALPEVEFCFVPMSRHPSVPTHDDLNLAQRLRDLQPRLAVLLGDPHPADVLAAFDHLSAVVSMRYHGMVFAEHAGVPLVPLVYADKNVRWLEERSLAPVAPEPAALTAALTAALDGKLSLSAAMQVAS